MLEIECFRFSMDHKTISVPVFIGGGAGSQGALSGMLVIGIESAALDF
jgi:hypothetical protein